MPNHIGEIRRFRLPQSGLVVSYSAVIHRVSDPADHRPAIFPQLRAPFTVEDLRRGRDPAVALAISHRDRPSVVEALEAADASESPERMAGRLADLFDQRFNDYQFRFDSLIEFGYRQLRGRLHEKEKPPGG